MAPRASANPGTEPTPDHNDASPAGEGKARRRHDWDAIERDFRTGQFTLKELSAKHGPGYADISRRATKYGWTKDLRKVVRQATSAAVIAEAVKAATTEAQSATTDVVIAAAEINKAVILGHRTELRNAREAANTMLAELIGSGMTDEHRRILTQLLAGEGADGVDLVLARQAVERALAIGNRVKSLKALSDAMVNLQAAERVAFGLDEKDDDKDKDPLAQSLNDFFTGIHGARAGRLPFAEPRKA